MPRDGLHVVANSSASPGTHALVGGGNGPHQGFRTTNITFEGGCGTVGITPLDAINGVHASATVVDITMSDASISLWLSNCDETSTLNVTSSGVHVIQGQLIAIVATRRDECSGSAKIKYQAASLQDYCRVNSKLSECSTIAKATSPAAKTFKLSAMVTMLGALFVLSTSLYV